MTAGLRIDGLSVVLGGRPVLRRRKGAERRPSALALAGHEPSDELRRSASGRMR